MADDSGGTPSLDHQPPQRNGGRFARLRRSLLGQVWREGAQLELMRRSMGFAAQGLVTLLPLLIVVAAIDPFREREFSDWVAEG